jgi:ornithine cyclodeaminase/alanine dehydrogenase-like protein (mu-crystallin family)
MLIVSETEIRELVDVASAREVIREAFRALHRGTATLPGVISVPFRDPTGLAHIKAGHLHGDGTWTVKVAADFYLEDGSPTVHSGVMFVFDAHDGALACVLRDNGYLTELRTGAAGAVAAELLARPGVRTAAIIGAGSQARFQLEGLVGVRPIERVHVASRSPERARAFVAEVEERFHLTAHLHESAEEAVATADVVITATPATKPVLRGEWLRAGTHVTAVGSDEPSKRELATDVFARASVIAVDDRDQAARSGELHHALDEGVHHVDVVTLGELVDGAAAGRVSAEDITVADLTGVGVQDAAIAAHVFKLAASRR